LPWFKYDAQFDCRAVTDQAAEAPRGVLALSESGFAAVAVIGTEILEEVNTADTLALRQ